MSIINNNFKVCFYLFFIIFFSFESKSETKVAFIQMDYLMNKSLAGKSLIEQLNKIDKKNSIDLKQIKEKLDSEKKDISQKKNILSDDEYNNKVTALNKKFESFQSDARTKVQKMKSLRDNGLQKIMNELNIILSEYSKKNELTFIIDQKNIIIGKTDLNITNEILKLLDQKLKKVKIN